MLLLLLRAKKGKEKGKEGKEGQRQKKKKKTTVAPYTELYLCIFEQYYLPQMKVMLLISFPIPDIWS